MKAELAVKPESVITLADLKAQFCPNATDKELMIACGVISSFGLNPYKREVHLIKYDASKPLQIVVGYEVYLKRAERTGKLDGWKVEVLDNGKRAKCTIHRKDFAQPFEWECEAAEFNKNQSTWNAMPHFMLKKVCIAQAFRICFSDDLGGLPYTKEENDIINAEPVHPEPTKTTSGEQKAAATPQKPQAATQTATKTGNGKVKSNLTSFQIQVSQAVQNFCKVSGTKNAEEYRHDLQHVFKVAHLNEATEEQCKKMIEAIPHTASAAAVQTPAEGKKEYTPKQKEYWQAFNDFHKANNTPDHKATRDVLRKDQMFKVTGKRGLPACKDADLDAMIMDYRERAGMITGGADMGEVELGEDFADLNEEVK